MNSCCILVFLKRGVFYRKWRVLTLKYLEACYILTIIDVLLFVSENMDTNNLDSVEFPDF